MRFLVRFRNVARMHGVDATPAMVELGRRRTEAEGFRDDRIAFTLADACDTGLPAESADFVWGEDAWCYVVDKAKLIREAVRLTKPRGTIAFTDWMEGPAGLSDAEAERFLRFMKFANVQSLQRLCGTARRRTLPGRGGGGYGPVRTLCRSLPGHVAQATHLGRLANPGLQRRGPGGLGRRDEIPAATRP